MAIYHHQTKIIGRQVKDKSGIPIAGKQRSIVGKAAYNAGQRLRDDRADGKFRDYGRRKEGIAHTEIRAPENSPDWLRGENLGGRDKEGRELRACLWNTIEKVERRKDSQLAREFELALPKELNQEQQIELLRAWVDAEIVSKGYVADIALHKSRDENNPHAHVLSTLRPVDADAPEGFGKKPDMSGKFNGRGIVGKGAKADLEDWRETWADAQNEALEAAGFEERVDHRTLEAQGIDREPGVHMGVSASAMERKGIETERAELSMWAKMDNLIRSAWRGIQRTGEVEQYGTGESWWERAQVAIGRALDHVGDLMLDESSGGPGLESRRAPAPDPEPAPSSYWQDFITEQQQERGSPELGFG